jgi:hypothetical protein
VWRSASGRFGRRFHSDAGDPCRERRHDGRDQPEQRWRIGSWQRRRYQVWHEHRARHSDGDRSSGRSRSYAADRCSGQRG